MIGVVIFLTVKPTAPDQSPSSRSSLNQLLGMKGASSENVKSNFSYLALIYSIFPLHTILSYHFNSFF